MMDYKAIEVFTSEKAKWRGISVSSAIVQYIRDLKIPARCMVAKGTAGAYESGEISTGGIEVLSYNMPVRVTIVLPSVELDRILPRIEEMVTDGIVAVEDLHVVTHKTRGLFVPRHTRVRDIMTPAPKKVNPETPLNEVARLLLSSIFTGLPVVDEENRPIGIIAQGDLIYKAGLPLRLGLLAQSDQRRVSAVLERLGRKPAKEVMTRHPVVVEQDEWVTQAVKLMLDKGVKRLPVVDAAGKLVGILSRVDIFHTVIRESPDWKSFREQNVLVENLRFVSEIMRRDTHTVLPDTPAEDVIRTIHTNDIQRVCVVDREGHFLGLISDRDLLAAFSGRPGIWEYFTSKFSFTGRSRTDLREHLRARTAAQIMNSKIVTVREDAPIEDAIRLMIERAIKRLPVLDSERKFKGMISRDSLLRTGFASEDSGR
ncbi:MAG: CBS domain-containing protein [Desulfobacteraceae bacterium]|nr:MAG: CBS domain-containing protein [Desulfobacteraceae bacterium]